MTIRIRMYRQGLGDCFLLTFFTGPDPVHVLVDCGTLGATTTGVKMADVVQNIFDDTGGHLHLLIATHEHKDHVSGFGSQRELFDRFTVDRVWLAWTENPHDALAQEVEKSEGDLLQAIRLAVEALLANGASDVAERQSLEQIGGAVRGLLDFYDDGGEMLGAGLATTVHEAMSYVSARGDQAPEYLSPLRVIEPDWLPGIRFYVLGPPRSPDAIKVLGDHDSPELYHLTGRLSRDLAWSARFNRSKVAFHEFRNQLTAEERQDFEAAQPFDARFRLERNCPEAVAHLGAYDDPAQTWRRIDHDWLTSCGNLALQLDNATNNTSLALAIEIIADGRVLLMAADAQLGNWQSWDTLRFSVTEPGGASREVTAADLLARTVFYKVGHHASHNATLKDRGLELMTREDLVAMIPVDRAVALNKTPPWQMPAEALYTRLLEKTRGRVLRSDTGFPEASLRPPLVTQTEWDQALTSADVSVAPLFVELRLT